MEGNDNKSPTKLKGKRGKKAEVSRSQIAVATAGRSTPNGPVSNVSVRGSNLDSDIAALTETIANDNGSQIIQQLSNQPSFISMTGKKTHKNKKSKEPTIHDIKTGLGKSEQLKVEDWLSLDKKTPKYTSTRKHFLRIINTLDYDEKMMEVSNYMTVNDLASFYESYNINCRNYIWKNIWGVNLDMSKTLEQNRLIDKSEVTDETGLDHFPTILLYFKDGFENEPKMNLDISINASPINTTLIAPPRNY